MHSLVSRRALALALVALGVACLAWAGFQWAAQAQFQRRQASALEQAMAHVPSSVRPRPAADSLVGRLEIPRIDLSAMVVEGDDEATLDKAVGHLPDTPMPWEAGNSALAGHRDTFFRPLRHVRVGDEVRLTSPQGTLTYRVSETFVTTPDDIGVLAGRGRPELTLVTCYPFTYIGHAPKRFIVRAERVEAPRVID